MAAGDEMRTNAGKRVQHQWEGIQLVDSDPSHVPARSASARSCLCVRHLSSSLPSLAINSAVSTEPRSVVWNDL